MATGRARHETAPPGAPATVVAFRPRSMRTASHPLDDRLDRAGFAIATAVIEASGADDAGDMHSPTVVGVLATLAAEAALAAAGLIRRDTITSTPGGWVTGGPADGILQTWSTDGSRTVWDCVVAAARSSAGHVAADFQTIIAHAEAHAGSKPYPVFSVPAAFRPRSLLRPAAARLRHAVHHLAADEGLCTPHEQALACGSAIGHVLRHEGPDPMLIRLAAEALIGAARLTPLPFAVR